MGVGKTGPRSNLGDGTTCEAGPVRISSADYKWGVMPPTVAPSSGVYTSNQTAVVTSPDANAIVHYSVDGAEPTESHPVIASGGGIPITQRARLSK